jgi:imidazolonepropionase
MEKLFFGIRNLVQIRSVNEKIVAGKKMAELPSIADAWLSTKDGIIEDFGSMTDLNLDKFSSYDKINLGGKSVLPTWADSHTHLVFAAWRENEFVDRINGLTYEEIAKRGGGILNSAEKMQALSEDELYESAMDRLGQLIKTGTGSIEIKSGYGLSLESELKMLRVIHRMKSNAPIPIKSTFLGAHAYPLKYKNDQDGYINLIIHEMLPVIASEGLADYIDAFCETGYFSVEQTERIISAGAKYGLKAKIHVNQFNVIGGIQACVKHNALTVDHLEVLDEKDLESLKIGQTIPVALPSCSFFLGIPYTPARQIIDAGLPLALATDFNPGSTPSGNMNFVVSLAAIKMKMNPEEAINAATINGAAAMELSHEVGSITKGKRANFIITSEIDSINAIPYQFGSPCIDSVYINGKKFEA